MNGASAKIISITFGISFIYVVCRTGLQLDYIALVLLMFLGAGQFMQISYIFYFSDCIHNLRFKNILVWFVCWDILVSGLFNHFWMLSHFAYIIATSAVANQTLPIRITGRNPFGCSSSAYKYVMEWSMLKACTGECYSLENSFISITCGRVCHNSINH